MQNKDLEIQRLQKQIVELKEAKKWSEDMLAGKLRKLEEKLGKK
jgi:hypothetical protein